MIIYLSIHTDPILSTGGLSLLGTKNKLVLEGGFQIPISREKAMKYLKY
jgi:hypothetical protein